MKNEFDRRTFMRISAMSIGAGALLQFSPLAATARGSAMSRLFHRQNGEAPGPFSIVQLSDTHVGFQGPPDPLGRPQRSRQAWPGAQPGWPSAFGV